MNVIVDYDTKKHKHPKLLKNLFNLTADDEKIPTDAILDNKIELLGFYMQHVWPLLKYIIKRKIWFFFRYKWKNWLKSAAYLLILLACVITTWKLIVEPIVKIETVTVEVEKDYINGVLISKKMISVPAERSELTKDNLDYFAAMFDIKNWYEVRQQILLESASFKSEVCINANNLFGMRLPGQRLTSAIGEHNGYAKYKHWVYSLYDYKLWQETRMRHLPMLKNESYYQWLVRTKYAEDEGYVYKLKSINWY